MRTKFRWIRLLLVSAIIGTAVLMAGYRLSQPEPETASASPVRVRTAPLTERLVSEQAMSVAETELQAEQSLASFENNKFGYQVDYPINWEMIDESARVTLFQSGDGSSQVSIEVIGPLSAEGLSTWVDRSSAQDKVLTRQLLTVQGATAERLIVLSAETGVQQTDFYIDTGESAYLISGVGEQAAIEGIARSFTVPQVEAQR
jgi:hypothetical protein